VGRVEAPSADPASSFTWNRAHFGAWCVVSAPLILGLELTDAKLRPVLDVITNPEAIAVNQAWAGHPGGLVDDVRPPPVPYDPSGAIVPSTAAGDFDVSGGATIGGSRPDAQTSGAANIRTGGPGQVSRIVIGGGLLGRGHRLDAVSLRFRYVAGYTPPAGQARRAPVVRLLVLDQESRRVVATVGVTPPLGEYSYDHFKSYSPPVRLGASGLALPNDAPLVLALEVSNNERNLQIPIDDKAEGFDVHVAWSAAEAGEPRARDAGPTLGFGLGQLWAKPQPGGAAAALFINNSPQQLNYTLQLSKLNLSKSATGAYSVRDIWARKNLTAAQTEIELRVPAYDSAFLLVAPASSRVI
jgi:hypothetical protein